MTADKYQVFLRVAELGSVTRAAEELGYTQSGVSHMINALEEDLALTLLRRGRSGVTLTDAGERLLPAFRAIVRESEQLRQTAAAIRGLREGKVRVGAFSSVSVAWLPAILKEFIVEEPGIEIQLLNGDYHDISRWIAEGAVDVAFVTLPQEGECELIPLKDDPLLVILPKEHPLAGLTSFPLQALGKEPFISLLASSAHDVRRVVEGRSIEIKVRYFTKDDYALIAMVENGLGISVVPELLLRGQEGRVAAIPPETHDVRRIALAVSRAPSPAARCFADFVCKWTEANA
ncbi:MAG: LysR family transcriptional regulator [Eubacteriales bacterium]|nr:LysR family transcriptional regulator [Eubacteriales bacterium]